MESRDPNISVTFIREDYPGIDQRKLIHSFVDSVINGSEALVTEDDVFKSMAVCFAIEKAVKLSRSVEVEYI